MTDPTLVNRRDFLHGYTAMHWAAKQGRCDMITGLIMNGAVVDIKSVRDLPSGNYSPRLIFFLPPALPVSLSLSPPLAPSLSPLPFPSALALYCHCLWIDCKYVGGKPTLLTEHSW